MLVLMAIPTIPVGPTPVGIILSMGIRMRSVEEEQQRVVLTQADFKVSSSNSSSRRVRARGIDRKRSTALVLRCRVTQDLLLPNNRDTLTPTTQRIER